MTYEDNRAWSDQFIPKIKKIVGPLLLIESDFDTDVTRATDLIVLRARALDIACRIRRPGYADRYPYEFTLRARLPNGCRTEFGKIIDGWGDIAFYGHTTESGEISRYFVICLNAFRAALIRDQKTRTLRFAEKTNGEKDSSFFSFDIRSFPEDILLESSHVIDFFSYE